MNEIMGGMYVIGSSSITGSFGYIIPLCLITGFFILRLDVKGYKISGMNKEMKVASFLGWANVCLGVLLYVVKWVFNLLS
jgi:hypothetical protein